ncbi:MAG: UDP-N-acetylmuramate--L-alanine ligase [Veillonella sp.]|nr:UDP-N-acetylmuramate--L-alanine ligase [Veillonella sp.]
MLDGIRKVHLIGIGGSGMRAIANILILKGFDVSGSDVKESDVINTFRDMGATIHIGHDASYVNGVDAVVRSTAIREDNPEIVAAKEQGIAILHRSDIVKAVLDVTNGIAVAGAHGKTSTTSMIGQILVEGCLDPTVIIGGEVDYLKGSSCLGKGEYSVVEADESDGSFLKLKPHTIVITNIEDDHMDYYKNMDNLLHAFCEFVENLPMDGKAVVCGDNDHIQYVMTKVKRNFVTYGLEESNDYVAKNIHYEDSSLVYDIFHKGSNLGRIRLRVPGNHNVLNSLAAFIVAYEACELPVTTIAKGLGKFVGAKRRFETKGHVAGVWVVDDYAHHPTEIKATLKAAKELEKHRVICVFQPHRYTRTQLLLEEFATAFTAADELYMTDIYSSGEDPIPGIDGRSIPDRIEAVTDMHVNYVPNVDDIPATLKRIVRPNDLVITMGAGSINQYGPKLLALLEEDL